MDDEGNSIRDARAWQLYEPVIRGADKVLMELDLLTRKAAEIGTAVDDYDNRYTIRPLITVKKLVQDVKKERDLTGKFYERYREATTQDEKDQAFIRLSSPNMVFYMALWNQAKKCSAVTAFFRNVEVPFGTPGSVVKREHKSTMKVDIIAKGGAEWVKILNIDSRRLLHKMAGAGWDWDCEDDEDPGIPLFDDENSTGIEILDTTRGLVVAAESYRAGTYSYATPSIRIVLTKLKLGEDRHIDHLIRIMRTMGTDRVPVTVDCGSSAELDEEEEEEEEEEEPLRDVFTRMLPTYDSYLTREVNLDGTVLFNLGSDTAHFFPDSFDAATLAKIEDDVADEQANGPRLLTDIYPMLRGRVLVCTQEAAENFRSTALDIGTATEVKRLAILMPSTTPDSFTKPSEEERKASLKALQELSSYPVPEDLILPIKVTKSPSREEISSLVEKGELPRAVLEIENEANIKPMTRCTLWQGLATQQATVTSNRVGMNLLNVAIGPGGIGRRKAYFQVLEFGRRLAAKRKAV